MYAIYAYIDPSNHPNVGIYGIHGVYGYYIYIYIYYLRAGRSMWGDRRFGGSLD